MNNMLVNAVVKNSASGTEYRVSDNSASDTGRGQDVASQPVGQIPAGQNSDGQIAIPSISATPICVEEQWIPISASGSHTGIQPDVMMSVYISGSISAASADGGIAPGQGRIRRLANGSFTGFGLLSTLGLAACITDGTGGTSGGGLPGDDAGLVIEGVEVTAEQPEVDADENGVTVASFNGLGIEVVTNTGNLDPQSAELIDNLSPAEIDTLQDQIAEAATEWAGEAAAAIAGAVEGLDAVAPDAGAEAQISDIRDLMASAAQSAAADSGDGDNGGFDVDVGRLVVSAPLLPNDGDGFQAEPIEYGLDPLLFALMEQRVEMAEDASADETVFNLDLSDVNENIADNQGLYLPLGIYSAANPYEQYSAFIPFVGRQPEFDAESDEMTLGEFVQNITGTAYADLISGNDRDNVINGGDGDDILAGGFGDDTLNGDAGDDILRGGAGADFLDGGEGYDDTVSYEKSSAVTVNLNTNAHSGGHAEGDIIRNVETIYGSDYGDVITGAMEIRGYDGDDILTSSIHGGMLLGDDGDDTLIGGGGITYMHGGDGADSFVLTHRNFEHFSNARLREDKPDEVWDFEDGIDMLVFDAADDADTSSLVTAGLSVADTAEGAMISDDEQDLMLLWFISADDITVADFEFV